MVGTFAACNNQGGGNEADDEAVTDAVAEPLPTPVGELNEGEDNEKASALLEEYIDLKKALVEDDFKKAKEEADDIPELLKSIEERALLEKQGISEQEFNRLQKVSSSLKEAKDIEALRRQFAAFSQELYSLAQADKLTDETLYWKQCPMALNNKGANWLSREEEIQNPYMGQKMPKCGSVKEVLRN